jgi:hypothetical protein
MSDVISSVTVSPTGTAIRPPPVTVEPSIPISNVYGSAGSVLAVVVASVVVVDVVVVVDSAAVVVVVVVVVDSDSAPHAVTSKATATSIEMAERIRRA